MMRLFIALLMVASLYAQDSSTDDSVAAVMRMYPDAGKEGTPLFIAMERQIAALKQTNPSFFDDPEWPMVLARMEAAKLGIEPTMPLVAFVAGAARGRIFRSDGGFKDVTVPQGTYAVAEQTQQGTVILAQGGPTLVRNVLVGSAQQMAAAEKNFTSQQQQAGLQNQLNRIEDSQQDILSQQQLLLRRSTER